MSQQSDQRHTQTRHEGQVLILAGIASVIFFAFAGMAIDVGLLLSERRGVQNAADAAVLAVARAMLDNEQNEAVLRQTAVHYVNRNGYEIDLADVEIDFDGDRVTLEVEHEVQRIFLGAFYDGEWSVNARAVASLESTLQRYAMIALGEDPNCHPSSGVRFSGNNHVNVVDGSIGSNACVRVDGNSLTALIDGNIEALHGIEDSQDRLQMTPGHEKKTINRPIEDPFAHLVPPTCSADGTVQSDPHYSGSGSGIILLPGRYTSDPTGGNVRQVSFLPGIYCIEVRFTIGSNLIARSVDASYVSNGQVGSGGGVLLYMAPNNGEIRFNGQGAMQIRALSYENPSFPGCMNACEENIAVWVSQGACTDFDAKGGSSTWIHGVIYSPCSSVELGGNPDTEVLQGMIVADTVRIHGNASLNLLANQDPIGTPPRVYLVE